MRQQFLFPVVSFKYGVIFNVLGISNSFAVLSDSEKRRQYDRYGEGLQPSQARRQRYHHEDDFEGLLDVVFSLWQP